MGPNKLSALLAIYPDGEGLTFPFPEAVRSPPSRLARPIRLTNDHLLV
jgi:hypothetical protein